MNNMNTFETSDIAIAAYIMMKGLKLQSAGRDQRGRFQFVFDDPNHLGTGYAVDFVNSESAKFDAHMKNLKNILYKS
tara:strand:+ start:901 stop:1131 length:231 start_codon:yes stop_codon:yes gene_type:complete